MINDRFEYIKYHADKASYYLNLVTSDLIIKNKKIAIKNLIASQFHECLISRQLKNPLFINLNYKQIYKVAELMVESQLCACINISDKERNKILNELISKSDIYACEWRVLLERYIYDFNLINKFRMWFYKR